METWWWMDKVFHTLMTLRVKFIGINMIQSWCRMGCWCWQIYGWSCKTLPYLLVFRLKPMLQFHDSLTYLLLSETVQFSCPCTSQCLPMYPKIGQYNKKDTQNYQGMKMLLASGVNFFIEVGFDMEVACCVWSKDAKRRKCRVWCDLWIAISE